MLPQEEMILQDFVPTKKIKREVDQDNYESFIGSMPQCPIMPGQTLDETEKYKFLAWNFVGSIAIKEGEDVQFSVI